MNKIEEVEIKGEKVYLKKGWAGWRVVEPIFFKDKSNEGIDWSTWSWKAFFNRKGLVTLGWLIFFLLIFWLAFREQIGNYHNVIENACQYCQLNLP